MQRTSGTLWILAYLALVSTPLVLMLLRPVPPARPFLVELAIALGFVGLVQIAIQFALVARYRGLTAPLGIDAILRAHRQLAFVAIALLLAHPILLIVHEPAFVSWLSPIGGTWASMTGAWALYALSILAVLSLARRRLRLSYEVWRVSHALLGLVALGSAAAHVHLAGRYSDATWKALVLLAFVVAAVLLLASLRLVRPALQARRPFRIAEVRPERGATWSVAIEPEAGTPPLEIGPGQFAYLTLHRPFTVDEHPFSFSSSAERTDRIEFAIKELGDFTSQIGTVPIGTRAFVDGPHGSFSIDTITAAGFVFVAGGIGIAPFIGMLRTMADRGDPRPVLLLYGERRWDDVAFRDELERLAGRLRLEVVHVLEEPPHAWTGETGRIDRDLLDRHLPREGFERAVLVCGPNPMIDAIETALRELGVPPRLVHAERFDLV